MAKYGGGHGNPLQCFCVENPMDRGGLQSIELQRVGHDWRDLNTQIFNHIRLFILHIRIGYYEIIGPLYTFKVVA